jgi:hypothetical protein
MVPRFDLRRRSRNWRPAGRVAVPEEILAQVTTSSQPLRELPRTSLRLAAIWGKALALPTCEQQIAEMPT